MKVAEKKQQVLQMLKIVEQECERVAKFKLLGTVLTEDNDMVTADIRFRIIMVNETRYVF
jgi:hypothetical protein